MNPVRIETVPCVVGLPTTSYVEYFGEMPDGSQFIIHRPRDEWDYADFCCLIQPAGSTGFLFVPVLKVTRYRDGGTTDIKVDHGDFHFPTPFNEEEKATFNGKPITVFERR